MIARCRFLLVIGCLTLAWPSYAQDTLNPSVQVDLLRNQIYAQAKQNDPTGALRSLDQYHQLADANHLGFPVPLYWIEAKAAHDAGDAQRALQALTEFLNRTDRRSDEYKEAIALYPVYQEAATQSQALEGDAKRAALAALAPEVLGQMKASLATVSQGRLVCPEKHFGCAPGSSTTVRQFRLMTQCIQRLWWQVFLADTGRGLKYDYFTAYPKKGDTGGCALNHAEGDVDAFVRWVSAHDASHWRLPTESELELVAERLGAEKLGQWDLAEEMCYQGCNYDLVGGEVAADCSHSPSVETSKNEAATDPVCDSAKETILTFVHTAYPAHETFFFDNLVTPPTDISVVGRAYPDSAQWPSGLYVQFRLVRQN